MAQHEPQPAIGERQKVVKVATDLTRRLIVGGELPPGERRDFLGQKRQLNAPGRAQFLLDAGATAGLHVLLVHHHPDAQRSRHLPAEDAQQLVAVQPIPPSPRPWPDPHPTAHPPPPPLSHHYPPPP